MVGSRGAPESEHLPRGGVLIGGQLEEVGGEGGEEGGGKGEGVQGVRGHRRRPRRVEAPKLNLWYY